MTAVNKKVLNWILSGGAFAAAIGASTGCSLTGSAGGKSPATKESAPVKAEAKPATDPAFAVDGSGGGEAKAPVINLFGEFDGADRGPVRAVNEANFQQHTYTEEGFDADVTIDPSGKWMAYASTRHSVHANLYLQKVGGLSVTQLTSGASDDGYPCFSPDGKQIAFASTRNGSWDVYVMDTDGKNVVQVTSGPLQEIHPSWSPDGSKLVYCATGGRSGQWEIWVVNLPTGEKKMIGFGLFPEWSPEKGVDRIAFQRPRQRGSRWFSLWTMEYVDGEARRVTEVIASTNAALVSPSWSPDGRRIAFGTIVEPSNPAVKGNGARALPRGQQDIWTVNADGSNRQRLTDGTGTNVSPFWATTDRVYFVSDRSGAECIWSVQADKAATFTASAEEKTPKHGSDATSATDTHEVVGH